MKITRREALEIHVELWDWLAETGCEDKLLWPGWGTYGDMRNSCPCCEYSQGNCKICPMKDFWETCLLIESDFYLWNKADSKEERKKYARRIAEGARTELAKGGKWN